MRGLLIAVVLLAGCDNAPAAPVAAAPVDAARVEAEKACAAITGYREGSSDKPLADEFAACVAAVATGKAQEPASGLRGRTDG